MSRGPVVSASLAGNPGGALASLKSDLGLSGAVMGVFSSRQPECEGVLAAVGVDAARLRAWCGAVGGKDAAWKEARRNGSAHARKADSTSPVRGEHVLTVALPASLDRGRFWYLACARGAAFVEDDELAVQLALRQQQVALDHVGERGLGRVLVAQDGRLLHADPATQAALAREPAALEQLLAVLRPVVEQRWGEPVAGQTYDAVLPLTAGATWVRFRRNVPVAGLPGHWYLELRRVGEEDPPGVGVMADDRLAKALAFLVDRYHEAPSLETIAEVAHISPFHFHRLFSTAARISPKHYVLRTQLMFAKWQLRATYRPISDIATATGFASHGHFTATFHRMVGVSPTTYREQEGNKA